MITRTKLLVVAAVCLMAGVWIGMLISGRYTFHTAHGVSRRMDKWTGKVEIVVPTFAR